MLIKQGLHKFFLLVALFFCANLTVAQSANIVVIDGQVLYGNSGFAQSLREGVFSERRKLIDEFAKIQDELTAEELQLTEARKNLPVDEFEALAHAFDEKSQRIRRTQDARVVASDRALQQLRQEFFNRITPVIAELMIEQNAAVVIDKANVMYSLNSVDITQIAIDRIDAFFASDTQ